jgi:predicted nuclease with TOPRIM domain
MYWNKAAPQYIILFFFLLFSSILLFNCETPVYSNTVDYLEDKVNQTEDELEKQKSYLSQIEARIKEISGSNYSLSQQISLLNEEISKLETEIETRTLEIEEKLKQIVEKEEILEKKKNFLNDVSGQLYMQSRHSSGQLIFSFSNLNKVLQSLFVRKNTISILREDIEEINGEYMTLLDIRSNLEKEREDLDAQKKDLDDANNLLAKEKARVQADLNTQIATKNTVSRTINGLSTQLSDLQYQLLIARQGGTFVNPESVPTSSNDINLSLAGFNANAPAGSFGVFSIGAYTHRNGMSQWGARARANAGQTYQQILNAYYPGKTFRTGTVVISGVVENIMVNIPTTTYGTLNFEDDYLLRLNEVPEYWPIEVLKAQAIAARTYAINYTQNGKRAICTTESCQVVGTTKKTGAWKTAVEATRGLILTDGSGSPFSTQYAAVHGGWGNHVGWDTTDGTGNGDWMSRAWDRMSGVTWFYRNWYRQGYSDSGSTCNRSPWLSQAEMSDILNAYQVWKAHNQNDSKILPIPDACHSNTGQYSHSDLFRLAAKPVTSISSVVVTSSNGTSTTVLFNTNQGVFSMSGNDFKTIYNLRAPGHLRIPQSGFVHINIHRK